MVKLLLDREAFSGVVWEPAVGSGNIASELVETGYEILASDIQDHDYPGTVLRDFYSKEWERPEGLGAIVTNPPYVALNKWIDRCISFRPLKLALLVPAACLGDFAKALGDSNTYSLTRTIVIRRPPAFVGYSGTAAVNWGVAWFVLTRQPGLKGEIEFAAAE